MKKILALALALAMLLSLSACKEEVDVTDPVEEEVKETVSPKVESGSMEGNVYVNPMAKIAFTKPEGWLFATEEELAVAMGMGAEILEGDFEEAFGKTVDEVLESTGTVLDMMVQDPTTGNNLIVMYENLAKSFASKMDEEQYAKVLKSQFEKLESSAVKTEMEEETQWVKLGQEEFLRCIARTESGGVTMQQVYYLKNLDGIMMAVTATLVSGIQPEEIEGMFSTYEPTQQL